MSVELTKGGNVNLTKDNAGLSKLVFGLGWDVNASGGDAFDLDAMALALKADGKVAGDSDFVYYGNLKNGNDSIHHTGDNLTGQGDGDDEQIKVDLSKLDASVDSVQIIVDIYQAAQRGNQNFGQVKNAFVRIVNEETGEELTRYDLSKDFSMETTVVFGELYRKDGEWKFKAVGAGHSEGIQKLVRDHAVHV